MRRRKMIRTIAGGAAVALWGDCPLAPAQSRASEGASSQSSKPLLGFKQYGMKRIPVRDAISQIAKIGYKSLSLTLMPSWDTEPKLLSKHSYALRLLQYVRDESHRFAQQYHHLLRKKSTFGDETK